MTTPQNLTPQLRFQGFDEPWKRRKFSDLVVVRRGLTYSPNDVVDSGVRVLRSSNIDGDSFTLKKDDVFVKPEAINIDFACAGDILITSANGSSRLVGKHALISGIAPGTTVPGGFMLIGSAEQPAFANALMSAPWYESFIDVYVAGGNGAIGNLNKADLDEQNILVPGTQAEQRKIGQLFQKLDHLITLEKKKHDKLKNIKKALLIKMFPQNGSTSPDIRFSGFTEPWEKRKFEDIATRVSATSSAVSLPRIEYEDIVPDLGVLNKDIKTKKSDKLGVVFNPGDVLYGKLRPYLRNWFLPTFSGLAIGDFWVLRPQNVDSGFLFRLIQGQQFSDAANQSVGTKMPRADWGLVSEISLYVPTSIKEQHKIGQLFQKLDRLITLEQQTCDKLQNIKKALLEKMFLEG